MRKSFLIKQISVNVSDERPFIKDKTKPPSFIGKFRGGYGNPWNAYTEDKIPLAQVFAQDLAKRSRHWVCNGRI